MVRNEATSSKSKHEKLFKTEHVDYDIVGLDDRGEESSKLSIDAYRPLALPACLVRLSNGK